MSGPFAGEPPTWVGELTDPMLRQAFGEPTFTRGADYAHDGAVASLSTGDGGRLLLAAVQGQRPYQTLVRAPKQGSRRRLPTSHCTCPVRADCKHAVAVLLAARSLLSRVEATGTEAAPMPLWESVLTGLLPAATGGPTRAPASLALLVELTDTDRVRVRPVARGKKGWVKSRASWYDFARGYGPDSFDRRQGDAVGELFTLYRAHVGGYPYGDVQIHLDDLGPAAWTVLRAVHGAGVPLVGSPREDIGVTLAEHPAQVVLDLRRRASGAELTADVRVPGHGMAAGAVLVGDPAHGIAVAGDGRLLLAPLEHPLEPATMRLLRQRRLALSEADLPRFLARYYPALRRRLTVVSSDETVDLPDVAPPRLLLDVEYAAEHVTTLRWAFGYRVGDDMVRCPPDGTEAHPAGDPEAEQALLASLDVLDLLPGGRRRGDDGVTFRLPAEARLTGLTTATFVEHVLPGLVAHDHVEVQVVGEPAAYAEADHAPLVTVSTDDDPHHPDWFDLGITVTVDGQHVPFVPLFTALARGEERMLLDSGTWFRLDRPELHRLRRLIGEARALEDRPPGMLRITVLQAGLWEELVELGVVAHQSERWQRSAGALLQLAELPRPDPPAGLRADLRPYQLDGYRWLSLLWDLQLGGILADDMGLGKTLQTLAMAVRAKELGSLGGEAGPLLVVAPASVTATWLAQAEQFCPGLRVALVSETQRRSGRLIADVAADADVVVTSYALLRIDEEAWRGMRWSGLVLDEAQFVKNHAAKTYQCARRLPAAFKLAITGTPLENSLMDLWSMLSITAPGLFPSPQRFADDYRRPIESGAAPDRLETLRRRVRPLMLRRTKEHVARDLPPKVEQVLDVTLNPTHRRIYDTHLNRERQRVLALIDDIQRNRIAIFRSLTKLRQLSLDASLVDDVHAGRVRSSKIDVLVAHLQELAAEGHRALVFSQFTRFLALVRQRLTAEGIAHCYLDGRTRDRPRRIAEFTEGDAPVFLISLRAGGFGLTLTEADYVFVLDPWWNPAVEQQAVDRAHRIGQNRPVMVYRLVATDTIEEKVVALQQRKRELFARVVDDGGAVDAALTAEDIRGLFAS
ncbi:MAG TPA: DEAD/DEAH box helicase [Mycobacteriales bacterium]|nr:DEAD/DEAH box helicase [Mycobacteriales bacterium]